VWLKMSMSVRAVFATLPDVALAEPES